jgi:hypothetical protein
VKSSAYMGVLLCVAVVPAEQWVVQRSAYIIINDSAGNGMS